MGWTTSSFSQFILNQIKDSLANAFLDKAFLVIQWSMKLNRGNNNEH